MNDATVAEDSATPSRSRKMPTRILLACAAIGAAGGLIIAPVTVFSSSGPALAIPLLYAILAMVKLLPGVLAQSLLRVPGVALLTCMIVGLINIAFSAHGPMVFVSLAGIGLLQEIPTAVTLYKRWNAWVLVIGNLAVGMVLAYLGWKVVASAATHSAMAIGYWAAAAVMSVVIAWIGIALGARVRRSGVIGATG